MLAWRAARVQVILSLAAAAAIGAMPVGGSWALRQLIVDSTNGAVGARDYVWVVAIASMAGLAVCTAQAAGYVIQVLTAKVAIAVDTRWVQGLDRQRGLAKFERFDWQDRVQVAAESAQTAPSMLLNVGLELVTALATISLYCTTAALIWPALLPAVAVLVLVGAGAQLRTADSVTAAQAAAFSRLRVVDHLRRVFVGPAAVRELRQLGASSFFLSCLLRSHNSACAATLRAARLALLARIKFVVGATSVTVLALVLTLRQVSAGTLGVADFVFFVTAAAALQSSSAIAVASIGAARSQLDLFAHFVDLADDEPPDLAEPRQPIAVPSEAEIRFDDVWFRYTEDSPWILRGLSFTIPAASTVGLVGLNGAGKSTVAKLLMRLYDPQKGRITWGGIDLRAFALDSLRARISAVFQDSVRYPIAAEDNITIGQVRCVGRREVAESAAREAQIHEKILTLPAGYDTVLSSEVRPEGTSSGTELSGGQWQRVHIARALVRSDASLLIMDEPGASLDAQIEAEMLATLEAQATSRTRLFISHRLDMMRSAEEIVVLGDGVAVEIGTHSELIGLGGLYARLFALQAQGFVP